MSSKKITAADKLEIVNLYRQAGDTTASLANRYGVSNSTISRLLKTSIPEAEYEILIQQKRGSKVGIEDEILSTVAASAISHGTNQPTADFEAAPVELGSSVVQSLPITVAEEDSPEAPRRLRRRSSAPLTADNDDLLAVEDLAPPSGADVDRPVFPVPQISQSEAIPISNNIDESISNQLPKAQLLPPIPRTPVLREILADSEHRYSPPVVEPVADLARSTDELDDDRNTEDVSALAAMFGEEIADSDEDDEDDDEDDDSTTPDRLLDPNQLLTKDRLHVQIIPLSQATLPRTCYIVVDKFAELIVRPLKEFADLGQISGEETQQRTLPIFDNHRVAKRFSNQRTQRVIKVPDSRVFYKTTQHLRSKGITRLLVDGNIYSLN